MTRQPFTFFYAVTYTPGDGTATIADTPDGGYRPFDLVGDADDIVTPGQTVTFRDPSDGSTFTGTFLGEASDGVIVDAPGIYGGPVILTDVPDGGGLNHTQAVDDVDPYVVTCFLAGVLIATPDGARAVETLVEGDLVLTHDGRAAPLKWLFVQTVTTLFADPLRVGPVRVRAGALGNGLPERDLRLSADHALLVDGALVQAGALVDGVSVVRETELPERFCYYHVELADHALVLAEGVPAETFVDAVTRRRFDNWREYEARHGAGRRIDEMDLPRIKSARQRGARAA
jgi:hypothetical protein